MLSKGFFVPEAEGFVLRIGYGQIVRCWLLEIAVNGIQTTSPSEDRQQETPQSQGSQEEEVKPPNPPDQRESGSLEHSFQRTCDGAKSCW